MANSIIEGDWSEFDLTRAGLLFRGTGESLFGIFKLSPARGRQLRLQEACAWRSIPSVLVPCCAVPVAWWVCSQQEEIMDATMTVITDRTLYRDVNMSNTPGTATQRLDRYGRCFDRTPFDGCLATPTGDYSGKLPLDRLQAVVSSVEPNKVIRLDGEAAGSALTVEPRAHGCCATAASTLCPVHHATITMAPHGMQLSIFVNSVRHVHSTHPPLCGGYPLLCAHPDVCGASTCAGRRAGQRRVDVTKGCDEGAS